jgi:two-component system sensor histidine kinase QseC
MTEPRRFSLKRRLLGALLVLIAFVWLGIAAYSYVDAREEVGDLLDAHMAQSASLIAAQARGGLDVIDLEHAPQLHKRARRVAFQIWERGRELRLHSANAPAGRLSPREAGFSNEVVDGRRWRVFSSWDPQHRYLIQVGERDKTRREIAEAVAASLLTPLVVGLPALGLLAWFAIARALRPVDAIGAALAARSPDNLAPLATEGAPSEIVPLVSGLNALFKRVGRLIESERRFTADAAHELRTPLAALKVQAQVARGAATDDERRRALGNVVAGCDRATRLVEQMLTLARLDPERSAGGREVCNLRALAREVIADLAQAAVAKGVELELPDGASVAIVADPDLIRILLRNLIDNAVRYSADGARIRVTIEREEASAVVAVIDEGPGIRAIERGKVGRRFYRIPGTAESGSGLGLSIVNRVAEMHGATVSLDDGPGGRGLRVSVAFPKAAGSD